MNKRSSILFATLCSSLLITACGSEKSVSYKADIKPITDKHCAECHTSGGDGAIASGFIVDNYQNLMKGTKYGPVIVPGDPLSSSFYRLVSGKVDKSIQMPHGREPLTAAEIASIENWINQGAQDN